MIPEIGNRIELTAPMVDDPDPIEVGAQGTVTWVGELHEYVQLGVKWDSGRTLGLVAPPDEWKVLS